MSNQDGGRGKEYTKTMSKRDPIGKLGGSRSGNGTVRFTDRDISRLHPQNVITAPPPSEADDVTMASPDPPSTIFGSRSENLASPDASYQRAFSSMSLLPRGWNPSIPPDGLSYQERSSQILETLREEGIISRAANRRLGASVLGPRRVSENSPVSKTPPSKTSPNVSKTQLDDDRIQTRIRESLSLNNVQERKMVAYQDDLIRGVSERVRASELRRQRILTKMADSQQAIFEKNAMRVKAVEKNRLKIRERKLQKLKREDMRRKRILLRRRCSLQAGKAQEAASTSPLDAVVGAGSSITNQTCNR